MVSKRGILKVYFENEELRNDFEEYTPLVHEETLEVSTSFEVKEIGGKWNGTGDFRLSFDGDIYIYDLALADNKLADMEERWSMQLEVTDKKIQANAEHIKQQGENLEAYRSEFLFTAEELRTEFTSLVQNKEADITEAYTGIIEQTAERLTSDYTARIADFYGTVTEEYHSSIEQTAGSIKTEVNGRIDDVENGIRQDMGSSITQLSNQIGLKVSQKDFDLLEGSVSDHETRITQNAGRISAVANSIKTDASGNITNISTSGLVLDSEFASLFSTQVSGQGLAKTSQLSAYVLETELGNLVSKIDISADQIDLTGAVSYYDLTYTMQVIIDDKAETSDLDDLEATLSSSISSLNSTVSSLRTDVDAKASLQTLRDYVAELEDAIATKADTDLSNAVLNGATFIYNGYIRTKYIDVDNLVTKRLEVTNDYGYEVKVNHGGIKIYKNDVFVADLNASGDGAYLGLYNTGRTKSLDIFPGIFELEEIRNGVSNGVYMDSYGIELKGGAHFENFRLGNITSSSISATTDFAEVSSDKTLPSPSSCPGKIIFIKCTKTLNITSSGGSVIKSWGSNTVSSSVSSSGASAMFFISNGTYWYGYVCH